MAGISSLKKRILGSAGANLYGQLVTLALQLVSVPILLHYWGTELYGEWLVMYALPSYIALSDFGISSFALKEICIFVAKGQFEEARIILRTTWTFVGILLAFALVLILGLGLTLNWANILNLKSISAHEASLCLVFLGLMALFALPQTLLWSHYRSALQNARGVVLSNTGRLAQLVVMSAVASFSKSVVLLAGSLAVTQILWLVFLSYDASKKMPALGLWGSRTDFSELKRMVRPGLAYMLLPLGNAFYFQGMTLVVNAVLGPIAVVIFTTTRTLTRMISQGVWVVALSSEPEFSRLFGKEDRPKMRQLYQLGLEASIIITGFGSIGVLFFGPTLLELWTHGRVVYLFPLALFLLIAVVINGIWVVASTVLKATNNHELFAVVYSVTATLGIPLAIYLTKSAGIAGAAFSTVLVEILIAVVTLHLTANLLKQNAIVTLLAVFRFKEISNALSSFKVAKPH